ncbi:MAG: hypothetical protein IJJ26_10635, partial [Victivallales bacterium]|nr:hypothetical protein [Victivallales bacterium]
MKHLSLLSIVLFCATVLAQLPEGVRLNPSGALDLAGLAHVSLLRYAPGWATRQQLTEKLAQTTQGEATILDGVFDVFHVHETLSPLPGGFRYTASLKPRTSKSVLCEQLCLKFEIPQARNPILLVDDKPISFPPDVLRKNLFNGKASVITVKDQTGSFTLRGSFRLQVVGLFPNSGTYQQNHYQLRVMPEHSFPRQDNLVVIDKWDLEADILTELPTDEDPLALKTTIQEIVPGPRWFALPENYRPSTTPGSPLDFSRFLDAPAGKYGRILVDKKTGHLVYEKRPDTRVKLFGTNLVSAAIYAPDEHITQFLTDIERVGYNTVRLHHFEKDLVDKNAPDSLTFDLAKLDTLFKLFARLKEHGFYVTIDLYASRTIKAGDNIPEFDDTGDYEMKNMILVSPQALENWKEFSRRLLTARNPYTGMTLAEDPALYMLNLINENSIAIWWNHRRGSRKAARIIEERFQEHLRAKGIQAAEGSAQFNGEFIHFLNELQMKHQKEQMRFLREDIKLQALITDVNHRCMFHSTPARTSFDLVDNHSYWDHPLFPGKRWSTPAVFHNRCSIEEYARTPISLAATRVFGKPFTVTEFNYCVPNQWRAEAATLMGGYSALQDWDGLYR